jgi:hypothetical protein
VVGISQPHVVAHRKVPSVAFEQVAHEATTKDEEGYVEEVRQFAQLEEDDACKVDRICKEVDIRKAQDL